VGDTLAYVDSTERVSEVESTIPEVIGEVELDFIISSLSDWCGYYEVERGFQCRTHGGRARRVWEVEHGGRGLQVSVLCSRILEDRSSQGIHRGASRIPEFGTRTVRAVRLTWLMISMT